MSAQCDFIWRCFGDLDLGALHKIFALRQAVFIVEQKCAFQDIDGIDDVCFHLLATDPDATEASLAGYLRLIPPGIRGAEPVIGRVITASSLRRQGIARELMRRAIEKSSALFGAKPIRLEAQEYLIPFYRSLDFQAVSDIYLEDGIPHVSMVRSDNGAAVRSV